MEGQNHEVKNWVDMHGGIQHGDSTGVGKRYVLGVLYGGQHCEWGVWLIHMWGLCKEN